ncbi:MAG: hypothetical protein ACHQJD_02335 [Thermoanaerobaculia bacterium]
MESTYEILRAMGSTRMFRDRVVSMEQTQEIGEKHVGLLTALATEAMPGYALVAHGLEYERDHFWLSLSNEETGRTCRVVFTRMFLSDANRLPAVVADPSAPVRAEIVGCIRDQASRGEILVTVASLLTPEERDELEQIEAAWRKEHEAALAAKRAEEERRAQERQRQKQQEEGRRQAQRERERRDRAAAGSAPGQQPQGGAGGRSGRRRRRGRGGAGVPAASTRPPQPQAAHPSAGPRPPQPANAPSAEAARAEVGGGRRRRRRGRGRGPGGPKPSPPSGNSN